MLTSFQQDPKAPQVDCQPDLQQSHAYGRPITDIHGNKQVIDKREKGIDVLCALAVLREAAHPGTQVVILASHDSDLEPAIDEARALGRAKIEAFRWDSDLGHFVYQLRATTGTRIWCTRLGRDSFTASLDKTPYHPL